MTCQRQSMGIKLKLRMISIEQNHNGCTWQLNTNAFYTPTVITDGFKDYVCDDMKS